MSLIMGIQIMKYYRLYYIYWNDGESGASGIYDIAQSTNKTDIDKIIAENNLDVVTEVERGQSNVFVFQEFEPTFPEYFRQYMLDAALSKDKQYKEETEFISTASEELYKKLWRNK